MLKKIKFYFTAPAAYRCKPMGSKHEWRAPFRSDIFPVCIKCGKACWWLRGYTLNSGTRLEADSEAQALMDNESLVNIPFNSMP